jgi:hypothetical protein
LRSRFPSSLLAEGAIAFPSGVTKIAALRLIFARSSAFHGAATDWRRISQDHLSLRIFSNPRVTLHFNHD